MKRLGIALVVLLAATMAGCKKDSPSAAPPSAGSSPSAAASASAGPLPSGSTDPSASPGAGLIEFTVDGAGPYQLGASLTALQAAAGLDEVKTGGETCPENTTARGKGPWREIRLQFRKDGTLYLAINRATDIPTPSGAWIGSTLAQLKTIYAKVTAEELKVGTASAYLVTTTSGRGMLFDLDSGQKVISMIAGESAYLKSSYVGGTDFC